MNKTLEAGFTPPCFIRISRTGCKRIVKFCLHNLEVIIKGGGFRVIHRNDFDRLLLRQKQIIPTQYKQFHANDLQ